MDSIITQIRLHLDEMIPTGQKESDTRFTDATLQALFDANNSVYEAVSIGWTLKAGMLAREIGTIDEYSAGNERYRNINLTTAINAAHSMAKKYNEMYKQEQDQFYSGMVFKVARPEVM